MSIIKIRTGISSAMIHGYCAQAVDKITGHEKCTYSENDLGIQQDLIEKVWEVEREGYGKTDGLQYFHSMYSLDPNDPKAKTITDKELAAMGKEFVDKMAPGHGYALYVHRDQEHPHIHIVWSTIHRETGKKYHVSPNQLKEAHTIVKEIDLKHDISPLDPQLNPKIPREKERPWEVKRLLARKPESYIWMDHLAENIRLAQSTAKSMDELKRELKKKGVELDIKPDKKITYSFIDKNGKQHKARHSRLGDNYSYERINKNIERRIRDEEFQRPHFGRDREIGRQEREPVRDIGKKLEGQPGRIPREPHPDLSNLHPTNSRETTRNREETQRDPRRSGPAEGTSGIARVTDVSSRHDEQSLPLHSRGERDITQTNERPLQSTHADVSHTSSHERTPKFDDRRPSETQPGKQTIPSSDGRIQRTIPDRTAINQETRHIPCGILQDGKDHTVRDDSPHRKTVGNVQKTHRLISQGDLRGISSSTDRDVKRNDVDMGSGNSDGLLRDRNGSQRVAMEAINTTAREQSSHNNAGTPAIEAAKVQEIINNLARRATPKEKLEKQIHELRSTRDRNLDDDKRRNANERRIHDIKQNEYPGIDTNYRSTKNGLLQRLGDMRERMGNKIQMARANMAQHIRDTRNGIAERVGHSKDFFQGVAKPIQQLHVEKAKEKEIEEKRQIEFKRKRSISIGR